MNDLPEGMKALRDAVMGVMRFDDNGFCCEYETAEALLAPDGPLWPLLRALGDRAQATGREWAGSFGWDDSIVRREGLAWLSGNGITGPLADACLAAAEVQP